MVAQCDTEQQPRDVVPPKRKAAVVSESESELERPAWLKKMDANKVKIKKTKRARADGAAAP